MTDLEKRLSTNCNLVEGTNFSVQVYKNIEDPDYLNVFIIHDGTNGAEYNRIKTTDDICRALSNYLENYI